MHLNDLSKLLGIISDDKRLKILCLLFKNDGICVSEITKKMKSNIAIISHHLKVLEKENVLNSSRNGKEICYKISKKNIIKDLEKFICKYQKNERK